MCPRALSTIADCLTASLLAVHEVIHDVSPPRPGEETEGWMNGAELAEERVVVVLPLDADIRQGEAN